MVRYDGAQYVRYEDQKVDQEQKPHERSFIRELVPDWRPTRRQVLWAIRIVVVLVLLLGSLTLIGLPFGITLWEWVKLLIVPAMIAGGGIWFNRQQQTRELAVESQRAQDEALQAYLEQMSQLLADKERPLRRARPGDSLSAIARARTLTVLARLDGYRKGSVLQFLYESGLVGTENLVINLAEADLGGAHLKRAHLQGANLRGACLERADLREARLNEARLRLARLQEANLAGADLQGAILQAAFLEGAKLQWANLIETFLQGANLQRADLSGAKLYGAELRDADLSGADLSEAFWPSADWRDAKLDGADLRQRIATLEELFNQQLQNPAEFLESLNQQLQEQAKSLTGATMPNGQKYEDWLKSKGSGEGENP